MNSLLVKTYIAVLVTASTLSTLALGQNIAQLRHASMAIRDTLPSTQEAKDFHNGVKSIDDFIDDWLASSAYDNRLRRYFNDMFGHSKNIFLVNQYLTLYQEGGAYPVWFTPPAPPDLPGGSNAYYLANYTRSFCDDDGVPGNGVVTTGVSAWFSDTPITVCNSAYRALVDTNYLEISAPNVNIEFTDDDGSHTASLTPGSYEDWHQVAQDLETAMEAQTTQQYSVNFEVAQRRFSITALTSSTFTIPLFGNNVLGTLGFSFWDDILENYAPYTGASSYTSEYETWSQSACAHRMLDKGECQCGKDMYLCTPWETLGGMSVSVVNEFQERGLYYYKNSGSWLDLFGGDQFVGDRNLYYYYLFTQDFNVTSQNPPDAVLSSLSALPVGTVTEVAMPTHTYSGLTGPNGPERAGVVTSPAFLKRFNNFRARIRAITERLMCQDVDGTLNIDNYATFNNPNYYAGAANNVWDHGIQPGCASCHYSLDNFGATILMWGDNAEGNFSYRYPWETQSQLGHVFGEDGTGPRFLMQKYLEQSKATTCMAKKAWEDFSGLTWDDLSTSDQDSFVSAAAGGPKATIETILTSDAFKNIR